jgi:hypothetical protein
LIGVLNVTKGQKHLLNEADFLQLQAQRQRVPKTPHIQILLELAHGCRERLAREPKLSRTQLAQELSITPTRLTQIIKLADLPQDIQARIRVMPPTIGRPDFTERSLRRLRSKGLPDQGKTSLIPYRLCE